MLDNYIITAIFRKIDYSNYGMLILCLLDLMWFRRKKHRTSNSFHLFSVFMPTVGVMERWCASQRSNKVRAAMTECFLPPSSSPAEQRRAEHPGGVARTPSSEEISPTKFPGLYRTGEPSPPHDGHHHEQPDVYVSDDDKEHSKKKNKFKKKEKRSKTLRSYLYLNLKVHYLHHEL